MPGTHNNTILKTLASGAFLLASGSALFMGGTYAEKVNSIEKADLPKQITIMREQLLLQSADLYAIKTKLGIPMVNPRGAAANAPEQLSPHTTAEATRWQQSLPRRTAIFPE